MTWPSRSATTARTWSTCWPARADSAGAARPRDPRQRGATLVEAVVGTAIVGVVALGVFLWIGLARWSQVDAQAVIAARAIAARELDLLQGLCREHLDVVITTGSGSACGYATPLGTWVDAPGYGVPGLAYRVEVAPVDSDPQAVNYDLARVTVTVRWERAFIARAQGRRQFVGYVFGESDVYWEDWQEWQGR